MNFAERAFSFLGCAAEVKVEDDGNPEANDTGTIRKIMIGGVRLCERIGDGRAE